jgi:ferric-dicitrate binding protein FerR (iron transport regulator)
MARQDRELDRLEQEIQSHRRAVAATWRALRHRRADEPADLAHAGAKPAAPRRSAAGLALGGLVGLALVVPRLLVRMSAGAPVGAARDRLPPP